MTTRDPGRSAHDMLAPEIRSLAGAVLAASGRVLETVTTERRRGAPHDAEAVHDFRVALRRLRTLLRPARKAFGKKRLRRVEDELRRLAQATGALRDEEVLRATLGSLELRGRFRGAVDGWLRRRQPQERARRRQVAALLRGDAVRAPAAPEVPPIAETLARLEQRLRPRKVGLTARELALASLDASIRGVNELAEVDPRDVERLHALRIRFKRLRYSAEIFAELLGPAADPVARSGAKMQRRLGDLHDIDEAVVRIGRARGLAPEAKRVVVSALRRARAAASEKAMTQLRQELEVLGRVTSESF
jgi:CHAD domain-containing protein